MTATLAVTIAYLITIIHLLFRIQQRSSYKHNSGYLW